MGGARRRVRGASRRLAESGGTTHISVVDGEGNAASLSASTGGGGSGVVVPGTGIHMNNMLGELDLMVGAPRAGERLTSVMAPSLCSRTACATRARSAGSNRLRGAIMQVVVNVIAHGLQWTRRSPRRGSISRTGCSTSSPRSTLAASYELFLAPANLFFGGVSAVERRDGTLAAAGDPRRGGAGSRLRARVRPRSEIEACSAFAVCSGSPSSTSKARCRS